MKPTSLYFIAIIPPEPVAIELMEWKKHMKNQYKSKAALKSPPHITLHMPFNLKESEEKKLIGVLDHISMTSFRVSLRNFGAFRPRVIYVDVESNAQMTELWKMVVNEMKYFGIKNSTYKDRGFTPHLTIAFRDLKKSAFIKAWEEFENKNFEATFKVSSFYLLKHDGKKWHPHHEFNFAD